MWTTAFRWRTGGREAPQVRSAVWHTVACVAKLVIGDKDIEWMPVEQLWGSAVARDVRRSAVECLLELFSSDAGVHSRLQERVARGLADFEQLMLTQARSRASEAAAKCRELESALARADPLKRAAVEKMLATYHKWRAALHVAHEEIAAELVSQGATEHYPEDAIKLIEREFAEAYDGTMPATELNALVRSVVDHVRAWPRSDRVVSFGLDRLSPRLRDLVICNGTVWVPFNTETRVRLRAKDLEPVVARRARSAAARDALAGHVAFLREAQAGVGFTHEDAWVLEHLDLIRRQVPSFVRAVRSGVQWKDLGVGGRLLEIQDREMPPCVGRLMYRMAQGLCHLKRPEIVLLVSWFKRRYRAEQHADVLHTLEHHRERALATYPASTVVAERRSFRKLVTSLLRNDRVRPNACSRVVGGDLAFFKERPKERVCPVRELAGNHEQLVFMYYGRTVSDQQGASAAATVSACVKGRTREIESVSACTAACGAMCALLRGESPTPGSVSSFAHPSDWEVVIHRRA